MEWWKICLHFCYYFRKFNGLYLLLWEDGGWVGVWGGGVGVLILLLWFSYRRYLFSTWEGSQNIYHSWGGFRCSCSFNRKPASSRLVCNQKSAAFNTAGGHFWVTIISSLAVVTMFISCAAEIFNLKFDIIDMQDIYFTFVIIIIYFC